MSRSFFCLPTYPLRIKIPFGRKSEKNIFHPLIKPYGQEQADWPKTFEEYVSHYLAMAEGIFCRGSRKKEQKNKPSRRKVCEKATRFKYDLFDLVTNCVQVYIKYNIKKAETPTAGGFGFVDYCQ